ncbi:amidohydrolase family protein [soil metagenome]
MSNPATDNAIIDVHAHFLLPALQEQVKARDPQGFQAAAELDLQRQGIPSAKASGAMIGERFEQLVSLERRLSDMAAAGVDGQIVSPSPSHYYPWAGKELAAWITREANAATAAIVAAAPERLRGLGLVPLQHPHLLVDALENAMLENGLIGVEISSSAPGIDGPGVELSDDRLEPFWARAEQLGAVLFLHPFGCSLDERLDRYYLSNTVGQPVENAVALSHLIFSGVLDRHPDLTIIAAHGGGYLPTFLGRSDHAWSVRPEAHDCAQLPSSYLSKLYFDSLVHTPDALRALVAAAGADRVLLGSDYPFDMGVADPVDRVRAASLDEGATDAILSGNSARLLGSLISPRP